MLASDPALNQTLVHRAPVTSVSWSPSESQLAAGCTDGTVTLWSFRPQFRALRLQGHTGAVHSVCFAPDGGLLASASADGTVRLWRPSVCVFAAPATTTPRPRPKRAPLPNPTPTPTPTQLPAPPRVRHAGRGGARR